LVGDLGALVDYRFKRRGIAIEVLSALIEYGFEELGVKVAEMDTNGTNEPWKKLMREMGLEKWGKVRKGRQWGEEEVVYRFEREGWEEAKRGLRERGKWLL